MESFKIERPPFSIGKVDDKVEITSNPDGIVPSRLKGPGAKSQASQHG